MSSINYKVSNVGQTHEGATARPSNPLDELKRTVLSCLLWEDTFYESGVDIYRRVKDLCAKVKPSELADLAHLAAEHYKLRHIPLVLARELARHHKGRLVGDTIVSVINRADSITEFLAIYWKDKKEPLTAQIKQGLARAFHKFNAYQLAKYNRNGKVKLRDALFLCHAKPRDEEQAAVWKELVDGTLESPDTWEVRLSGGEDKKIAFESLLSENKLGDLAFLRNLRNMMDANVNLQLITERFAKMQENASRSKILPFQFVAAARAAPRLEQLVDGAMLANIQHLDEKLLGKTYLLIDVSGSMDGNLSEKSKINRIDAAGALAAMVNGISDDVRVWVFSDYIQEMPRRAGMAMVDNIRNARRGGTHLGAALDFIHRLGEPYNRLIIITDEQSHDTPRILPPKDAYRYVVNVAPYQKGLQYNGRMVHISGFSEAVIKFIIEYEKAQ